MEDEAAPGVDRTAAQHPDSLGARRQSDRLRLADDVELHQQAGEIDVRGAPVDDDAHRAVFAMGAQIHHRARERAFAQAGHGDQELAFITLPGRGFR